MIHRNTLLRKKRGVRIVKIIFLGLVAFTIIYSYLYKYELNKTKGEFSTYRSQYWNIWMLENITKKEKKLKEELKNKKKKKKIIKKEIMNKIK